MNRQECQQCTADRKSELHLEAVKLNWSSFSPLFKWLYPQQVQKGTSEEKTNTTKRNVTACTLIQTAAVYSRLQAQ